MAISNPSLARSTVLATLPQWSWILSLIFAGCCSNAYYLEQATRIQPACGTLMTFLHFLFTTLQILPTQVVWGDHEAGDADKRSKSTNGNGSNGAARSGSSSSTWPTWLPRLRRPSIPLSRWAVQVLLYFGTSILNNSTFSFHVPVPVHIIFRSGGLVVSMLVGYLLKGRRYSLLQIVSVLLVTGGVIASTLATTPADVDHGASSKARAAGAMSPTTEYFCGIAMLTLALFLSALMGLYQESTYAIYGSQHWQEGLFYNHCLSLPLFALRYPTLAHEWKLAFAGKRMWVGWGAPGVHDHARALRLGAKDSVSRLSPDAIWDIKQLVAMPAAWLSGRAPPTARSALLPARLFSSSAGLLVPALFPALTLNVLAQLVCINGVNRLTAMCSSLTVTLVLVVRKAVSLAISVLIIAPAQGEEVEGKGMLAAGATAVLVGTLGYTLASAQAQPSTSGKGKKSGANKESSAPPTASTSSVRGSTNARARKR